ncbi:MAG: Uma2 family endonuclease [Acidobacteriota bacterium]|nr:Uma2 family endonuclease [Acidobacteriota bacterium]
MSALPKQDSKYTIEEYIELLKNSDERFEYFDGEVVSMAAGKIAQGGIAANVGRVIGNLLEGRNCQVFGGDTAVKTIKARPFRLPDVTVVCGDLVIEELQGIEMLVNPVLIVEVLSKRTRAYDLHEKFLAYQAIESLKEYILIDQTRPHVIRHVRQPDGQWLRGDFIGMENVVRLESLDVTLSFPEIYRMIIFPEETSAEELFN